MKMKFTIMASSLVLAASVSGATLFENTNPNTGFVSYNRVSPANAVLNHYAMTQIVVPAGG